MAKTTVKCPICGKENNKEYTIKIGNRYYCAECSKIKEEKMENFNKEDWDQLFNYVCKLYHINKPTGAMFKQLKDFRAEPYNFKDKGMYLTLKYVYETLGIPILTGAGLGIIPYYYDKAKDFFIKKMDIKEELDKFEDDEQEKNIKISNPFKYMTIKQKSLKDIDWGDDIDN